MGADQNRQGKGAEVNIELVGGPRDGKTCEYSLVSPRFTVPVWEQGRFVPHMYAMRADGLTADHLPGVFPEWFKENDPASQRIVP